MSGVYGKCFDPTGARHGIPSGDPTGSRRSRDNVM